MNFVNAAMIEVGIPALIFGIGSGAISMRWWIRRQKQAPRQYDRDVDALAARAEA